MPIVFILTHFRSLTKVKLAAWNKEIILAVFYLAVRWKSPTFTQLQTVFIIQEL